MKHITKIVTEEINKYLYTIIEKSDSNKTTDTINHANKRDGKILSTSDEDQLRNDVNKDDIINIAALARKVYPDHTPEGAQSQLRKKLKGLKSDSGSEYHIRNREANTIRQALNSIQ